MIEPVTPIESMMFFDVAPAAGDAAVQHLRDQIRRTSRPIEALIVKPLIGHRIELPDVSSPSLYDAL